MEFYLDNDGSYVLSSFGIFPALELNNSKSVMDNYKIIFDKLYANINLNSNNRSILLKYLWIARQIERLNYNEIREEAGKIVDRIMQILASM